MKVVIEASAKLNLSLNIEGKRDDGYHLLSSVFQSIDFKNVLCCEEHKGFLFMCDDDKLPLDERNTAVRAVMKFAEKASIKPDVKITLSKKVPYGAGMGSASSDAAAALCAMNIIYHDLLSEEELMETALSVGADVPFAYNGGTCFIEGIGEKLTRLKSIPECAFLVVKPSYSVSTKEAYALVDSAEGIRTDNASMLKAIDEGDLRKIGENMDNAFYHVLNFSKNEEIKGRMLAQGAAAATLTGSGSAVFGLFEDTERALFAKKNIEGSFVVYPNKKSLYIK